MTGPSFTRAQIKAMPAAERAERVEELNEALAEGRVTDGPDAA